jgi:hypothetical protein
MVTYVNRRLKSLKLINGAVHMQFKMSDTAARYEGTNNAGHFTGFCYWADIVHYWQYHAEDILVVILESMEDLGYHLQFQQVQHVEEFKQIYIFHKMKQSQQQ